MYFSRWITIISGRHWAIWPLPTPCRRSTAMHELNWFDGMRPRNNSKNEFFCFMHDWTSHVIQNASISEGLLALIETCQHVVVSTKNAKINIASAVDCYWCVCPLKPVTLFAFVSPNKQTPLHRRTFSRLLNSTVSTRVRHGLCQDVRISYLCIRRKQEE